MTGRVDARVETGAGAAHPAPSGPARAPRRHQSRRSMLAFAVAAQAISLTSFGLIRRRLTRVNGRPTGFGSEMIFIYALTRVFSYRQFRRQDVDAATAGWTLAVSAIFLTSALAGPTGVSRSIFGVPAQGVTGLDVFLHRVTSVRMPGLRCPEVLGQAGLNCAAGSAAQACAIPAMSLPVPWDNLLLVYGAGAPDLEAGR